MPKPLVKAGSGPPPNALLMGGNNPSNPENSGLRAPPKVSTVEELALLEKVTVGEDERPRLRKPGADDDEDEAASLPAPTLTKAAATTTTAKTTTAATTTKAAPAPAPAPAPEMIEVTEEVEEPYDPDALPEGWQTMQDEEGDTFYYNMATQEAQWEKPAAPPPKKKLVTKLVPAPSPAPAPSSGATKTWNKAGSTSTATTKSAPAPAPAPAPAKTAATTTATTAAATSSAGVDPEACDAFEPNPFRADMCRKCRKKKDRHAE